MHMRTLVVNPPERLRLNPSRGRISHESPNFCSKESKRRRVAVKMRGKGCRFSGFTTRCLFRLSKFKTAALSSSRSGAWLQHVERKRTWLDETELHRRSDPVPLDRSCTADLIRRNGAASTERPSAVGPRLHSVAGSRSTEAVCKTVDYLPGTQLRCAHASRPR